MHARALVRMAAMRVCLVASLLAVLVGVLGLPARATAQEAPLRLPALSHLQAQAIQSVNVTLDAKVLGLLSAFADDDPYDADFDQIQRVFNEITSVTVRSLKFDAPVQPGTELDDLRRQLASPAWSPLVQAHDRDKSEDVGIYLAYGERVVHGLVILAVSPRQVTLVHVQGRLEPSRVAEIRRTFEHPAQSHSALATAER